MADRIKGFPPYNIDAVVKIGGSLMQQPERCRALIAEIETLACEGHRLLLVPGGGLPDNAIESVDATYPLSPFTAHHACALAQDQTGYMLADSAFSTRLRPCSTLGACRQAIADDAVPILLPSQILFHMDPVSWSWDITSDAVAAWFAWLVGATRLVIVTNVDGVFLNGAVSDPAQRIAWIAAADLARLGHTSIDACAADFLAGKGLSGAVLNGAHPERLAAYLRGEPTIATEVLAQAPTTMAPATSHPAEVAS
ncbi:aspartate kinase [Pontivivens ytuae]|uniref:Aspartate kinase n=1 Tax=Pontivivens ytuae TaxID=2789856 RepID=A0A7S9QDA4_9RHOB|nr:aspartate kinase [Pontivivens ytuae]QPH54788.1 aspartate kinase [Pontivivens ytuae]